MSVNWTEIRRASLGDTARNVVPPTLKLPMLPTSLTLFLQAANDPDAALEKLGDIIQQDTGLTCELLRYVNSSLLGLRRKASTAQHALTMLGIRQSRLYLITQGVKSAMNAKDSQLIQFQRFWATNLERALFAREVAKLLKADADLAFSAAMLCDALLPIMTNQHAAQYLGYLQLPEAGAPDLPQYERRLWNWDHAYMSAQVMCGWQFPDDLVVCVLEHHGGLELLTDPTLGQTSAAAVAVAGLIPDALRQSRLGLADLHRLEQVWPRFCLLEIATRVEEQLLELAPASKMEFSLKRRCEQWATRVEANPTVHS